MYISRESDNIMYSVLVYGLAAVLCFSFIIYATFDQSMITGRRTGWILSSKNDDVIRLISLEQKTQKSKPETKPDKKTKDAVF